MSSSNPSSEYHGVTKVAKNAGIAKKAESCINCISNHPIPPKQTLLSRDPKTHFRLKIEKNQKDSWVGGHISEHRAETWTMHGTEHCTGDHRLFRI